MTNLKYANAQVWVGDQKIGTAKELVFDPRNPAESVKAISLEWHAKIELVGGSFRRALGALRTLFPVLRAIEEEQRQRALEMRAWSRRKGRKK